MAAVRLGAPSVIVLLLGTVDLNKTVDALETVGAFTTDNKKAVERISTAFLLP